MLQNIAILGSTGSVGTQTLDVCRRLGLPVGVLTAHSQVEKLAQQAREFRPHTVVIGDPAHYSALKTALADLDIRVLAGPQAICQEVAADGIDLVVNAIVGIAGLRPTLAAAEAGKRIALSNKESLVAGGGLVMPLTGGADGRLLPVDSEHSAIWQCLAAGDRRDVHKILLTASGGPFVGRSRSQLEQVTVAQALAHPNWSMGAKISVDSATLMNKGLEVIEAMWLFDLQPEQIEVVVHRQSVIHSAVEFVDGAVIAQLGLPDMAGPIQYAITYPRRKPVQQQRLSLIEYGTLSFEAPDTETFQCLEVCFQAARRGGISPCVANGANEQAVAAFLQGKLSFLQIGQLVAGAVADIQQVGQGRLTLDQVEQADRAAREYVLSKI